MTTRIHLTIPIILFAILMSFAQGGRRDGDEPRRDRKGDENRQNAVFRTEVPAHEFDVVLGRPTGKSVTASVLLYSDAEVSIVFGIEKGRKDKQTAAARLTKGNPHEFLIDGLKPATRYIYSVMINGKEREENSFITAREPGASFSFAIQADSHLDEGIDTDVYRRSLENVARATPDFMVDLGDTFMTDKYPDYRSAAPQYVAQRYYFGLVGNNSPIFLTLGNHDGENGFRRADGMYEWSNEMRRRYFPNPVPDGFYSGSKSGAQNYYAWEWGDAQFIVLDPFTYTTSRSRGNDGNWNWTLGREQYEWLRETLAKSRAKLKFVFIHHLVGGADRVARGGAEVAHLWEWGGGGFDAADVFKNQRAGFEIPIHQLFARHKVAAVFHGHDHLYVKQELDGIVYQEVPQPGHRQADNTRNAEEYGYKSGIVRGSSGVLIVRVNGSTADVDYVRAFPENRRNGRRDGSVEVSYKIVR